MLDSRPSADPVATDPAVTGCPSPARSPFDVREEDKDAYLGLRRMLAYAADSREYVTAADEVRTLTLRHVSDRVDGDRATRFLWPSGLFIPGQADPGTYGWIGAPGRYDRDWVTGSVGWGAASRLDGSLHAVASSPTSGHEIHGSREAGVGVLWTATHSLSRLRILPDINLVGRFQWAVDPKGQPVFVSTRVVGRVVVRGLLADPATGGFDVIDNSPQREYQVFDDQHPWSNGGSAPVTTSFVRSGSQVPGVVLTEAGRTYLLGVSVQVSIDVHNEDSSGRPAAVTNGRYDTFGSLTGLVPQIYVE